MDLPIFHVLSLHSIAHLGFGRCSGEDHRDRRLDGSRPRLQGKQVAASSPPFGIGGRLVEDQIGFEDDSKWVGVSTVGLRTSPLTIQYLSGPLSIGLKDKLTVIMGYQCAG